MQKAIETHFNGYHFRSRREARWSIFLDLIKVQYEYEPEAFELDGLFYLPDFYLPQLDCFLEIKGCHPTADEFEKAIRLAKFTKKKVYIEYSPPKLPNYNGNDSAIVIDPLYEGSDFSHWWCECPVCHHHDLQYTGYANRINCQCEKEEIQTYDSVILTGAYQIAAGYRFS